MPELPEVQTVADHIKPDLIGKYIIGVDPIWKKVLHNFSAKDLNPFSWIFLNSIH